MALSALHVNIGHAENFKKSYQRKIIDKPLSIHPANVLNSRDVERVLDIHPRARLALEKLARAASPLGGWDARAGCILPPGGICRRRSLLASSIGISTRQVTRITKLLRQLGIIRVAYRNTKHGRKVSVYVLAFYDPRAIDGINRAALQEIDKNISGNSDMTKKTQGDIFGQDVTDFEGAKTPSQSDMHVTCNKREASKWSTSTRFARGSRPSRASHERMSTKKIEQAKNQTEKSSQRAEWNQAELEHLHPAVFFGGPMVCEYYDRADRPVTAGADPSVPSTPTAPEPKRRPATNVVPFTNNIAVLYKQLAAAYPSRGKGKDKGLGSFERVSAKLRALLSKPHPLLDGQCVTEDMLFRDIERLRAIQNSNIREGRRDGKDPRQFTPMFSTWLNNFNPLTAEPPPAPTAPVREFREISEAELQAMLRGKVLSNEPSAELLAAMSRDLGAPDVA